MASSEIENAINNKLAGVQDGTARHAEYLILSAFLHYLEKQGGADIIATLDKAHTAFIESKSDGLLAFIDEIKASLPVVSPAKDKQFVTEDQLPSWLVKGATGDIGNWYENKQKRELILLRDAGYCVYCGADLAKVGATYDHIIPQSSLANFLKYCDKAVNIVASCACCNFTKGDDILEPLKDINNYDRDAYLEKFHEIIAVNKYYPGLDDLRKKLNPAYLGHTDAWEMASRARECVKAARPENLAALIDLMERPNNGLKN